MALIAAVAAVAEFITEMAVAAEVTAEAAGIVEGTESMAALGNQLTAYEAAGTTAGGYINAGALAGSIADPLTAATSMAIRSAAPATFEMIGAQGAYIGEGIGLQVGGEVSAGVGARVGYSIARGAAAGLPAHATAAQIRAWYNKVRNDKKHGIPPHHFPDDHKILIEIYGKRQKSKMAPKKQMFPRTRKMKMRWSSNKCHLTVTGGTATTRQYVKLNNLVNIGDGWAAGGATDDTHEPMGWTQMSAIYDNYVVTGARARIDYFVNQRQGQGSDGSLEAVTLGVSTTDAIDLLNVPGHYEELDNTVWVTAPPESVGRLSYAVDIGQFTGIPKPQLKSESTLRVKGSSNPDNQIFMHLWGHSIDGNVTAIATRVEYVVTMEYDVVWMEPKALAQS